jgi:hydroxymethylpyrimidine/phosphomethylpyrimidine kinase
VCAADRIKAVLTVAGSDPSGGAGIQADLKTFSRLGVYGMAVVAAMTAQNTLGVSAVAGVEAVFLAQQLDAVLSDIPPDATKTGMLLSADAIEVVANKAEQYRLSNLVVDPVMIATSGATLMKPDALSVFRRVLVPHAFLITPNLNEAAALTATPVRTIQDMEHAASRLHEMGARHALITGGHLDADHATDVLFDGQEFTHFRSGRIATGRTHGTGCVLSAAIASYLALGHSARQAVALAKEFVTTAIRNSLPIGHGAAPCDPLSSGV